MGDNADDTPKTLPEHVGGDDLQDKEPEPSELPSVFDTKGGCSVPTFSIRPWERKGRGRGGRVEPIFTATRQRIFLNYLLAWGVKWQAAAVAGVSMDTVMRFRKANPEFARDEISAEEFFKERLEQIALKRATEGWIEPVFGKDGQVGTIRKFDNGLLQFMLKHRVPERYRDKVELQSNIPTGSLLVAIPLGQDLDKLEAELAQRQDELQRTARIVNLKKTGDGEYEPE